MSKSDNPIFNTINDVLGLGKKPEGFIEKISALEILLSGSKKTYGSYAEVLRADKNLTAIEGAQVASGPEVKHMFKKLHKLGLVPDSAETAFTAISKIGGSIFFNAKDKKLFYGESGLRVSSLPLDVSGAISFGQSIRKVNSIGMDGGQYPMSFADAFYTQFGAGVLSRSTKAGVHAAVKYALNTDLNGTKMRDLLLDITDPKGIDLIHQARWTAGRSVPFFPTGHYFSEAFHNFHLATAGHSMLVKTGGRMIYEELPGKNLDYSSAFSLIDRLKSNYLGVALPRYLKEMGAENAFPFVKADYLGNKDKFLLPDKSLNVLYGSKFEAHTLSKGLFHLANIRSTTYDQISRIASMGSNPFSYYTLASDKRGFARRDMRLKVGVVDTLNPLYSQMYFGEGGAILSKTGAAKLAGRLPIGSMKISSPTLANINAAERLFGVNLAEGYTQSLNKGVNFTKFDVEDAFNLDIPTKQLNDTAKEIRIFTRADPRHQGLLTQLARQNSSLSKIRLTDASLSLDFITAGDSVADAMEIIAGARRFTTTSTGPLAKLANSLGVDVLIGADEYMKTFGPNVYLTNFIEKVSETKIATQTFNKVFGQRMYAPSKLAPKMRIPVITDHDSAFAAAQRQVSEWKASKSESLRRLAESIEHGTQVINATSIAGITGVRVVGMAGGLRTDFMGDINISKPVRFTPSKMINIAKGSAQLGYFTHMEDPMFRAVANMHSTWRTGEISINPRTFELELGSGHSLRKLSNALLGVGAPNPADVVSMQAGKLFYKGDQLANLPKDISLFSHGSGGVSRSFLDNTILGINKDLVYLDLGKEVKMSALGIEGTEKMYRYLPVPIKYLRMQQGVHGNVILNKTHPSYDFVKSLIDVESGQGSSLTYTGLLKALIGNKGLFVKSNTIVANSGARVRLMPGQLFNNGIGISSPESMFHGTLSWNSFDDYLIRKSGMSPATARTLREQVTKKGYFHAIVGVDPLQRAEHANIHRIYVKSNGRANNFLGQMGLILHPFWHRMTERDLDRDVANLTPLTGSSIDYEDRIARQAKAIRPFMGMFNYELKNKTNPLSVSRLTGIKLIDNAVDYLTTYLGVPKSLGYTITRASDTIMNTVIGEGISGAASLGILNKNITSDMIEEIRAPYLADPERLSVVQKGLQYLYQGAVQKGSNKSELITLAEDLVTLGNDYKGSAFNATVVKEKASDIVYKFIKSSDKHRAFMMLDYLVEKNLIPKESTSLMLADLESGASDTLIDAAMRAGETFKQASIKATANLLGEYLGPAMVLAAGIKKMPKTITGLTQKNLYDSSDEADIISSVLDAAGDSPMSEAFPKAPVSLENENIIDDIAKEIPKAKGAGFSRKLRATLRNNKTAIGVAAGIGAVVGASIVGMAKGPLPRDVDGRQPTDIGPEIIEAPPRIYGTNQRFNASRERSPSAIPSVGGYSFKADTRDSMLIRTKSVNLDSYELERRLKQISQSDYNY